MSYVSEVLADSPVIYLRLDEAAGTNAADSSGSGNPGTYTNIAGYTLNQPSLLTSDPDASVKLTRASSGYVSVADSISLDLPNADIFTMEAWIKLSALGQSTNKTLMSKQNGAYAFRVRTDDRLELLRAQTAILKFSISPLASVGPHHVAATKSGASAFIYLNGVDVTNASGASTCVANSLKFLVGVDGASDTPDGSYFDGWLDEVAVYGTALSSVRILAHYNAGVAAPPPSGSMPSRMITVAGGGVY